LEKHLEDKVNWNVSTVASSSDKIWLREKPLEHGKLELGIIVLLDDVYREITFRAWHRGGSRRRA
jgi:hypothetical protein